MSEYQTARVEINGVEGRVLLDIGSELSTITFSFLDNKFSKQDVVATND